MVHVSGAGSESKGDSRFTPNQNFSMSKFVFGTIPLWSAQDGTQFRTHRKPSKQRKNFEVYENPILQNPMNQSESTKIRTTAAEVLDAGVHHLVAGGATHLALVLVVLAVGAADGSRPDAVAVAVALLRTLTARRQPVQRGHALRAVRTVLLFAWVLHIWRVDITSPSEARQRRELEGEQEEDPLVHAEREVCGAGGAEHFPQGTRRRRRRRRRCPDTTAAEQFGT